MSRKLGAHPLALLSIALCFLGSAFYLSPSFKIVRDVLPDPSRPPSVHFNSSQCVSLGETHPVKPVEPIGPLTPTDVTWRFQAKRDARNYALNEQQCEAAFPDLFQDVDRSVSERIGNPITSAELDLGQDEMNYWNISNGTMRAMIYDGELFVLNHTNAFDPIFGTRTLATLHGLARALQADPSIHMTPNVEFLLGIGDTVGPHATMWGYARRSNDTNTWLMPDFNFFSWPEPGVGSYQEVRRQIEDKEKELPRFEEKIPKIFWRGNCDMDPFIRWSLVDAAKDKEWADVRPLNWSDTIDVRDNLLPMEDHCKYQFIAHTEGHSYSGRLKYVQHCNSLVVAHKMQWLQPAHFFLRSSGPEQNFIEVKDDFSDLEQKILHYQSDPGAVDLILTNSAKTFRDRYLTPAAEACYWRRLIRGYGKVSFEPELYAADAGGKRKFRGVPFESFALMRQLEWAPH